jgi:hypothetical protein
MIVLSVLWRHRTPSFAFRTFLLCISAQVSLKFVAWLGIYLELIAYRLEVVALILLVPRAFVQFDTMGLLALVFLAVGACVLLWLVVLVLLFFFFLQALAFLVSCARVRKTCAAPQMSFCRS